MPNFRLLISGHTHACPQSDALNLEWLETNGLGGYASSTVSGSHTRSYHGLFVVQSTLVNERLILLSKLEEKISYDGKSYELSSACYPGTVHPKGFEYLEEFSKELLPKWSYQVDGLTLKKELCYVYSNDIVVLSYESSHDLTLDLQPFFAFRNYHSLLRKRDSFVKEIVFTNDTLKVVPEENMPAVFIQIVDSCYSGHPDWFYNYELNEETARGLNHQEDLFTAGTLSVELKAHHPQFVVVSTEEQRTDVGPLLLKTEKIRRTALFDTASAKDSLSKTLILAADQFVFKRPDSVTSIIAGYHWFTDWGRDTMISITGLCLATHRFSEAREILLGYAEFIKDGLLPNRFPDKGSQPEYHTVDAALWYVIACYEYVKTSGDKDFIKVITPRISEVVQRYRAGTHYKIKADVDGLISCGDQNTNLTWMDARVNGMPVTPRNGKPVEISCLWYNSLKILAEFLSDAQLEKEAELTKSSFEKKFWLKKGYLSDCIQDQIQDESLRPNQIFALSLPFPLIDGDKALSILAVIEKELLTPVGLRTLSPEDPRYCSKYEGSSEKRDSAYHQGTVWMWLLGHYVKAVKKFGSPNNFKLDSLAKDLARSGVGTLSEIYDGDSPHRPRGCIAQAWSVGAAMELIRT